MTTGVMTVGVNRPSGFAPRHRLDRDAFLLLLGLTWVALLAGFGLDNAAHFKVHEEPYPLVIHLHAAVATGWMVLLTVQMLLVRQGHAALHQRIGIAAVGVIPVMAVLGLAAAWTVQRQYFYAPDSNPQFLGVNITDMVVFAALGGCALALRRDSAAHKRLFLLTAVFLSHAGFARWLGLTLGKPFGQGVWAFALQNYLACDVLIAALGVYDLATRGRLNGAFTAAVGFILANEALASWLNYSPGWKQIATHLIGH